MNMVVAWSRPNLKLIDSAKNLAHPKVHIYHQFSLFLLQSAFSRLNYYFAGHAVETEQNMMSALSRISDLERELEFAKKSNEELETLRKNYQNLEAEGKAHDEELAALLDPVAKGLSDKKISQHNHILALVVLLINFD